MIFASLQTGWHNCLSLSPCRWCTLETLLVPVLSPAELYLLPPSTLTCSLLLLSSSVGLFGSLSPTPGGSLLGLLYALTSTVIACEVPCRRLFLDLGIHSLPSRVLLVSHQSPSANWWPITFHFWIQTGHHSRVPTASRYCVHLSFNIFQSSGTLFSCKDWLNILVRGWSICCLSSFNNCGNMVSGPVDLFGLSLSRYFFTLWLHVVSISRGGPPLWVRALRNGTDVLNHEYGCEINVDVVSEWPIQLFSGSVGVMPWWLHSESPGSIPRSCCTFQDFSVCYCSFSNEGDWCFLLGRIFICALNFFNSILWCSASQHTTEAKQRQCSFVHSRHLGSWMEW